MPRPVSKDELLTAADAEFTKLQALLASMSAEQLAATFAFSDRDRCVRDVLIHLHEWHVMLVEWMEANLAGREQPFLPAPYTWKSYGQLNVELLEKHQTTSLADAFVLLQSSTEQVLAAIRQLTNEELFDRGHFSWTGTTTLGSYCVSTTSSHYQWALKKLRTHRRTYTGV